MVNYLLAHEKYILNLLKDDDKRINWKEELENHRAVTINLQHERLIHLLVTLAFGLAFIIFMMFTLTLQNNILIVFDVLTLILLVPYIFHYYKLENGVQRLYLLDRKIELKVY